MSASELPLVSIKCTAYNHEPYIAHTLEGFVRQKTNFRFEAIVHDDASTDKTADIIRAYAAKYPDIIKPIFETENQYSKHDGSLRRIMDAHTRGKYVAMCEGDDYWTDPLKLQRQVGFMEKHPDYTMCCTDAIVKIEGQDFEWSRFSCDADMPTHAVIEEGGIYIYTCSILYRQALLANYPKFCAECVIGDYPLQIWAAINGKIRYLAKKTCVYTYMHAGSWSARQCEMDLEKRIPRLQSEFDMLLGINDYTAKRYNTAVMNAVTKQIFLQCARDPRNAEILYRHFGGIIDSFAIKEKVKFFMIMNDVNCLCADVL